MKEPRLLVCGSRNWRALEVLDRALDRVYPRPLHLGHGNCRGADQAAGFWAEQREIPVTRYCADWARHGRSAGPRRNIWMLEDFQPDKIVAFKDDFDYSFSSAGTEHMALIALRAGVPVWLCGSTGYVEKLTLEARRTRSTRRPARVRRGR